MYVFLRFETKNFELHLHSLAIGKKNLILMNNPNKYF